MKFSSTLQHGAQEELASGILQEPSSFSSYPWFYPVPRVSCIHTYIDILAYTTKLHHISHKLVSRDIAHPEETSSREEAYFGPRSKVKTIWVGNYWSRSVVLKGEYGLQVSTFLDSMDLSHYRRVIIREGPEWSLLKGEAWVRNPSYLHLREVPWKGTVIWVPNSGNKEEGSFQNFKVVKS